MKTKLFLICTLALCVIALSACAAPTPDPASQIKALVDVLNAGNVDAAIAFFTDDATQTQQPPPASGQSGVRTGKDQIRGFYKGLVDDRFSVELSNVKVAGDKVTYTCTFSTDSYKKMGVAPLVTMEEAVFVGGKIKSQTINVSPESLAKIQAAMAAAAKPVPPPDLASLIKSQVDALNTGNIEAVMAFYTDGAIQTMQPPPAGQSGVWTGKEQIRGFFSGLIADHFSVELSNAKVAGDKITYTCAFSTDTYKKMGVAPVIVVEEAVFEGSKIKSKTITVTPESLAKIQAAMAAVQAKSSTPMKKVLVLITVEYSQDMELLLTKEVGVMMSMIEKAGYKPVVASPSGQPLVGNATTLKPDMKLTDVKVEDYVGVMLPCLSPGTTIGFGPKPAEAVAIVTNAVAQGKPVAAQLTAVDVLSKAGILKGKQFAIASPYVSYIPEGVFKGMGVVQDGNIITSGLCPYAAQVAGMSDGTAELTQKFIALLPAAR